MAIVDMIFGLIALLPFLIFAIPVLLGISSMFVKIIKEYERGVLLAFGEYRGIREPGLNLLIPFYHKLIRMDLRVFTADVPKQEIMTEDNVPAKINAVIYYKVKNPEKAFLEVENYNNAVSKYGQTSLRNVAGEASLDELLAERDQISSRLKKIVDEATDPWGIEVTHIELMDIEVPENLKRTMAKQAEAERERRATIIKSEGEAKASKNLAEAAKKLYKHDGAMHLRTLHSLNDMSSDQTNTINFIVPVEVLRAVEEVD